MYIYIYIYTHFYFDSIPIQVITEYGAEFPVLYIICQSQAPNFSLSLLLNSIFKGLD